MRFMVDHPEEFLGFKEEALWSLGLCGYDPWFLAPLGTGVLAGCVMRTARHPWAVVLARPENWWVRANLSLGVAMVAAGLPLAYQLSLWVMLSWRLSCNLLRL
jgi:hypothetical protein